MLGTVKGRNEDGYPMEGLDRVSTPKESHTIPTLVQLLQEANRRATRWKEAYATPNKKYQDLYQEHVALKFEDFCQPCQTKRDTTPPGRCIELCRKCSEGKQTLQSLRLELEKKDETIRYWQECYETALKELYEGPSPRV